MLIYFFQIPFHFLVQFFVNWQLNPVKFWKDISKDYPRNYFGNCTCQKAKMQSHTKKKKKKKNHCIIRLNSLLSLEYSRFTWWSCTSQIMAEAGAWSQQRQTTYASIRRVRFLNNRYEFSRFSVNICTENDKLLWNHLRLIIKWFLNIHYFV